MWAAFCYTDNWISFSSSALFVLPSTRFRVVLRVCETYLLGAVFRISGLTSVSMSLDKLELHCIAIFCLQFCLQVVFRPLRFLMSSLTFYTSNNRICSDSLCGCFVSGLWAGSKHPVLALEKVPKSRLRNLSPLVICNRIIFNLKNHDRKKWKWEKKIHLLSSPKPVLNCISCNFQCDFMWKSCNSITTWLVTWLRMSGTNESKTACPSFCIYFVQPCSECLHTSIFSAAASCILHPYIDLFFIASFHWFLIFQRLCWIDWAFV